MFYSAQVKIYRDPYNGQLMNDHPTEYIQDQITLILILIFSTTVHHYLVQRDLLIIVIEKQRIISQQTQLSQFFMKSEDSIIVAVNEGSSTKNKIEFYNDAVGQMLGVTIQNNSGDNVQSVYQVSPITIETPIFKLKVENDIFAAESNYSDPNIDIHNEFERSN